MVRALAKTYGVSAGMRFSAAEAARRAFDILNGGEDKWAKGDFHVGEGFCMLGAIGRVLGDNGSMDFLEYKAMEDALIVELKATYPELEALTTIPEINDHQSVTYENVLKAFEKVALQFEEKEGKVTGS